MTATQLEQAQSQDRLYYRSAAASNGTNAVDRYFEDKLADCRRRRKAAILLATHLVGGCE